MAVGSFLLTVDQGQVEKQIIYTREEEAEPLLDENSILKIRMRHQSSTQVLTIGTTYQYLSHVKQIDVKRKTVLVIGGVIMLKEMNSAIYQDAIELFVEKMISHYDKDDREILNKIKEYFFELFDQPQLILDQKELEQRLSEKVKNLNKEGRFDEANDLLKKIKKIPNKLYASHELAERSMMNEDFDKALKEYQNAYDYAKELEEAPLMQMYSTKINLAKKTPSLLKKREKILKKAMEGLRSDNFSKAQKYFKKAAIVSERLMDTRHVEEYNLKSQALAEYVKVEKKFK